MPNPDCIFCKIAVGQVPCVKLLEDEHALAFMDIGPLAEGHVLLIPRQHFARLDEVPADVAGAVLRHLPCLARAVQKSVGCEGYNVLQNNGRVANQLVQHVHFHIIPRNSGDAFHFNWPAGACPSERLEQLAGNIRQHLNRT